MSIHSFVKSGVFGPEALAAMSEAYEAALKELQDTGLPELVLEIIAERIIERLALVSGIRFACGRPRSLGLPANKTNLLAAARRRGRCIASLPLAPNITPAMNGLPQLARRRTPLSKTTIIRGPAVGDIVTTKRSPNWTAVSMAACSAGPILEQRTLRPSENVCRIGIHWVIPN